MLHNVDLILTLAGGLSAALVLGFITQKLRMSPIVGYLLAGIIVGPYSPGFVADADTASQCAEIGIILLMFGVGLHFHLKDLLAVQRIVLPGAAAQIGAATLLGMVVSHGFGWSWAAGAVFGMAMNLVTGKNAMNKKAICRALRALPPAFVSVADFSAQFLPLFKVNS